MINSGLVESIIKCTEDNFILIQKILFSRDYVWDNAVSGAGTTQFAIWHRNSIATYIIVSKNKTIFRATQTDVGLAKSISGTIWLRKEKFKQLYK